MSGEIDDVQTVIEQIEVTPTPRVLSMLGEIEFAPWRCLAELCDNSFDHGLALIRDGKIGPDDNFRVSVVLPRSSDSPREAEVTVMDTGEGMALDELNNAVRAGWTGNDPFENLGLFGMGFNIATARLGQRTRVTTTKRGDTHWVGVEIDLRALQERGTFDVPVIREKKDDPEIHGTRIQVSRLNAGNYEDLTGNRIRRTRETLGDVYAPLLLEHADTIDLRVNGQVVSPRDYCVWDDSRSVHYGSGANAAEIPAVIRFAHELPDGAACEDCRRWQDRNNTTCQFCESTDLRVRPRHIHGWIGVQRYLDTSDYGIDFIRNGRKILIRDKSLFTWDDPNSLSNDGVIEYPVEPPANHGRLIGQVHIDHVPVEYKKTTFVDGPEWKAVRDFVRGDGGPLRPKTRRDADYPGLPDGPLGKLYRAFNANRPGDRHLIPGNGKQALHEKAREWGKRFHDGDPDYQDDSIWWTAVETHEKIASADDDADFSDLFGDADDQTRDLLKDMFGDDAFKVAEDPGDYESDDHDSGSEDADDSKDEPPATWRERCERWVDEYPVIPDLDFDVAVPGSSSAVHMTTYLVGEPVLDEHNQRAPVFSRLLSHVNQLAVFVDETHPLFTRFDTPTVDIVFAEVADWFRGRFHSTMSISEIISRLKEEKLSDRRLDARISEEAAAILEQVREAMAVALDTAGEEAVSAVASLLLPRERADTEQASESRDGRTFVDASKDGGIVRYVPAITLPRIVEALPSVFFDGKVFVRKHDLLQEDNQATRRLNVARIVGYLYDLGILADQPVRLKGDALRRAALSIPLIGSELADVEAVADTMTADHPEPSVVPADG